jgi:hypothetical protein
MMGGGMGGGMMGGGMRSLPPTDLPSALLKPNQTRSLPTRLVSLATPDEDGRVAFPEKDEPLRIGEIGQINSNSKLQTALKRLAQDKAPTTLSQLVMWNLGAGMSWDEVGDLSKRWSNPHELALAKHFVQQLGALPEGESGRLLIEVSAADQDLTALASGLSQALKDQFVLGLKTELGVPATPTGPAVACRIQVAGTPENPDANVQVSMTNGTATEWTRVGKFSIPMLVDDSKIKAGEFTDALAEEVLSRLVRAQLTKGQRVNGKLTYKISIENASPLVLNGLAVLGEGNESRRCSPASRSPRARHSMFRRHRSWSSRSG